MNYCLVKPHCREGNGNPLQYSCLENPMDGGAWRAAVHGVAESRTRLSDFTFTFHFHALEKEMATHCSVLAWRIPGIGEPGGLSSMGLRRFGHDWSNAAATTSLIENLSACFISWFFLLIQHIDSKLQIIIEWELTFQMIWPKDPIIFKLKTNNFHSIDH